MPATNPPISSQAARTLQELGEALRSRRRDLKVNSTSAAEAAGVSRPTFHRIEKGEPSVTAGAYAAAALALGMRLDVLGSPGPAETSDRKGWIPARIDRHRYPKLKELAWHVQGVDELTAREALDIYRRNWRHLDRAALSDEERDLIDALQVAFGTEHAV